MHPTTTAATAAALAVLLAGPLSVTPPFTEGESPEGIAFDHPGDLYVSNRRAVEGSRVSEVLHIDQAGTRSVLATLDVAPLPGPPGVLGLATDPPGDIYAAVASFNPATHGVWRIDPRDGSLQRLAHQIPFPNALTFDPRRNLYVSDSTGAIWRIPRHGEVEVWIRDVLLAPANPQHPVLPPVGANGIAFAPPNLIYVANTQRGLLARVAIEPDGSAGPLEVLAQDSSILTIDGIAVDVYGAIHAVIPGFVPLGTNPLVMIDPVTGTITPTPVDPSLFDTPLSLAFGAGRLGRSTVFITNGNLPSVPGGPGPGIVQVPINLVASRQSAVVSHSR